jgi:hypothetical protein
VTEFKVSYSDNDIKSNVDGGRLPQADTRLRYRIVQALDRQAAALEAIVGLLEKMAAPPMQTDWSEDAKESEVSVLLKPEDLKPRKRRGAPTESADASELE